MSMIGKTLGNFEITTQPGRGCMGEVYLADGMAPSGRAPVEVALDLAMFSFQPSVSRYQGRQNGQ